MFKSGPDGIDHFITPSEVNTFHEEVRFRLAVAKQEVASQLKAKVEEREQQARDLIDHVATIDRWVIGYGAGITYLMIEGVGFLIHVPMTYRILTGMIAMISLIVLGVEKILRREALKKAHQPTKDAEEPLQDFYHDIKAYEEALASIDKYDTSHGITVSAHSEAGDRYDQLNMIDQKLKETVQAIDKDIDLKSAVIEELMPILKKRLDVWSLIGLSAATIVLVLGVVHLLIVGVPPTESPSVDVPQAELPVAP